MTRLRITTDDINRSRILPNDWYPCEIIEVEEKSAKTDGSLLWVLTFRVISGEYQGAYLYHNISEKAPGFAIPLFEVFEGVGNVAEGDYDPMNLKGKKLLVASSQQLYNGNMKNTVTGFRAL